MQFSGSIATQLHYDKMNDKSTMLISKGLKEKKQKAPNAETAFVSDLQSYQAYYITLWQTDKVYTPM